MPTQVCQPPPALAEFVSLFWLHEGCALPHGLERALPTGTAELVINLREDRLLVYDRREPHRAHIFPGAILCGPHAEYFLLDRHDQEAVLGVHFKPGGTAPFFRYPAGEWRNRHIALDALWGAGARELRERLLGATTPEATFAILGRALLERAVRPLDAHPALAYALREIARAPRTPPIAAIAARLGLSPRRLAQLFDEGVGLSPKLYARVHRFQGVLRRIERGRRHDWLALSLAAGYYDQAHLIRDFRDFTGLTPATYLARRGDQPNHVPLAD